MQSQRTTTRRRPRACSSPSAPPRDRSGLLAPSTAAAAPANAAEASRLVQKAAQELDRHRRAGPRGRAHRRRAAGRRSSRRRSRPPPRRPRSPSTSRSCGRSPQSGYTGETQSRRGRVPHQRVRRRAGPADDDAGHDRRAHQRVVAEVAAAQDARRRPAQAGRRRGRRDRRGRPRRARGAAGRGRRSRSPTTRPTSPG